MLTRTLLFWLTIALAAPSGAAGGDALPGPVPAEVLRVVDGDTVDVRARIWLGQTVETRVRLAGIDTPESRGGCPAERALADQAAALLTRLLADGDGITLSDIDHGSFAGRVVARVESAGQDVTAALLASGLARPYTGRGPRPDWCEPRGPARMGGESGG